MTREEALKILDTQLHGSNEEIEWYGAYANAQAMRMAIKALEREALEQEPCEDCISRQDLIKAIEKKAQIPSVQNNPSTVNGLLGAINIALDMPSVQPLEQEPKTGHWIYDKTIDHWRCSKCNETPKTMGYVGTADFMAEHFKFCNHCGAKMESEDKE